LRVCSTPNCPNIYPRIEGTRCAIHRREADKRRGTATQRGYTNKEHQHFRDVVLKRDPICVLCHIVQATTADHYPHDRKQLILLGMNPNDPKHGRGLCARCHNKATAQNQPGGFNNY